MRDRAARRRTFGAQGRQADGAAPAFRGAAGEESWAEGSGGAGWGEARRSPEGLARRPASSALRRDGRVDSAALVSLLDLRPDPPMELLGRPVGPVEQSWAQAGDQSRGRGERSACSPSGPEVKAPCNGAGSGVGGGSGEPFTSGTSPRPSPCPPEGRLDRGRGHAGRGWRRPLPPSLRDNAPSLNPVRRSPPRPETASTGSDGRCHHAVLGAR